MFDHEVDALRKEVDDWRALSHAMWAIWGVIQSLPPAQKDVVDKEVHAKPIELKRKKEPVSGMRSPFLPPSSPRIKRISSYKSPSYFPIVMEHAGDDFSLGESALEVPKTEDWVDEDTFDYNAYSLERIQLFYGEVVRLGLVKRDEVPPIYEVRVLPERCFR